MGERRMEQKKYKTLYLITLKTGEQYVAEWVRFNSHVPSSPKWRRPEPELTKKQRWIDDDKVAEWREI